jgi:hypothetical protein
MCTVVFDAQPGFRLYVSRLEIRSKSTGSADGPRAGERSAMGKITKFAEVHRGVGGATNFGVAGSAKINKSGNWGKGADVRRG